MTSTTAGTAEQSKMETADEFWLRMKSLYPSLFESEHTHTAEELTDISESIERKLYGVVGKFKVGNLYLDSFNVEASNATVQDLPIRVNLHMKSLIKDDGAESDTFFDSLMEGDNEERLMTFIEKTIGYTRRQVHINLI